MKILVSGGTGFIGSHTVTELINNGYDVTVFDNLSNSSEDVIDRIEKITGNRPKFVKCDMLDIINLEKLFSEGKFDGLIHFAGLKAVGESVSEPLKYYENNVAGSVNVFKMCLKYGVNKIIFSSSATVYGCSSSVGLTEDTSLKVTNPYGRTKLMQEDILRDLSKIHPELSVILLRYFNPVGAHKSGIIGESPNGIPNNLMPRIVLSAAGKTGPLKVFGNDYPTRDGSCIRDYIHVTDLANGHIRALQYTEKGFKGIDAFNLGSGIGVSVLELLKTFERVNGLKLDYTISDRRPGDVAEYFADVTKAETFLDFKTEKTVEDMCRDSWNYYLKNN